MNQDDIFRLLLIVLLSANRQLEQLNADSDTGDTAAARFNYGSLNDIIILSMFMQLFDYTTQKGCPKDTDSQTTF